MAVVAVFVLAVLLVGTLGKPVPGDWDHEIRLGQDAQHFGKQFQQHTDLDDFQQTHNQDTQQVGRNHEFEDVQQNQNEQHDIEQLGDEHQDTQQVGQNHEFEDVQQSQNEQHDIEQLGDQHQDTQQVGQNHEFEDVQATQLHQTPNEEEFQQGQNEDTVQFQQRQHHKGMKQAGQDNGNFGLQDKHTQQNDDEIIQLLGSDKYGEQQHDQNPAVEPAIPKQHHEEVGVEYVPTETPRWWKRIGQKISNTYEKAKDKAHNLAHKLKETVG
jgi:hypothetical protein